MSEPGRNRRKHTRLAASDDHGIVSVRIRPGHAAALVDVSSHGALLETAHRLLPGHAVELQIETDKARANVRGRVVRCAVVRLRAASLLYRGAVAFDRHLPWSVPDTHSHGHDHGDSHGHDRGRSDSHGHGPSHAHTSPHADHRPALPGRAPATQVVA
jgi:hypothetical protein